MQTVNQGRSSSQFVLVLIAFFLFIFAAVPARAQYTIVADLYGAVMTRPNDGNTIIRQNQQLYNDRFFQCISQKISSLDQAAQNHYAWCYEVHSDPENIAQCIQENEPAKLAQMLRIIGATAAGDVVWSNTIEGTVAIVGKREFESMYPGMWEQLQRSAMVSLRPVLTCQ